MRLHVKAVALAAAGALALAVPAVAHPGPKHDSTPPATSNKCMPHNVAFIVHGTVASWSATQNADGTWSGSITVTVTRTNHHAKGTTGSYTLTNTKVTLDNGVTNPPVAGDRVTLTGKITVEAKKCGSFTGTTTIKRIVVHLPAKK